MKLELWQEERMFKNFSSRINLNLLPPLAFSWILMLCVQYTVNGAPNAERRDFVGTKSHGTVVACGFAWPLFKSSASTTFSVLWRNMQPNKIKKLHRMRIAQERSKCSCVILVRTGPQPVFIVTSFLIQECTNNTTLSLLYLTILKILYSVCVYTLRMERGRDTRTIKWVSFTTSQ